MASDRPRVVDADGDAIEVYTGTTGVALKIGGEMVVLDAAMQEEFAQLYVHACHEWKAGAAMPGVTG